MTTDRRVIAIDCDDVLIDATQYLIDTYNATHGTHVSMERSHVHANPEWGAEGDEILRRLHEIQATKEFGAIAPREDAVEAIHELAKSHELHLVTARADIIANVTARMVDEYFPGCFASMLHVGHDKTKGDACAAIGAHVLIDDNIRHLESAHQVGVDMVIWFGDYPWQVEQEEQAAMVPIKRCRDWQSVLQALREGGDEASA